MPPRGLVVNAALGLLLVASGCARTPEGASARVERQLIVQMTVRGQVDPQKHYFFAVDTSGEASEGPVPVVAPPWGNGWGAGRITHYVRVDASQPGFYGVYRFEPGSNLLASTYLGRPLSAGPVQGTSTLTFALNLDELLTPAGVPPTEINVNFIATDRIPIDPNDRSSKLVDALGNTGNNYLTLNTQASRIYRNEDASEPERQGDVPDPSLDIVDWQIEVRKR